MMYCSGWRSSASRLVPTLQDHPFNIHAQSLTVTLKYLPCYLLSILLLIYTSSYNHVPTLIVPFEFLPGNLVDCHLLQYRWHTCTLQDFSYVFFICVISTKFSTNLIKIGWSDMLLFITLPLYRIYTMFFRTPSLSCSLYERYIIFFLYYIFYMIHFTGSLLRFLQDIHYVYSFTGSLPCSLWWLSDLGQGQFHHRLFHRVHHPSQSSDWHSSRPGGKDRRAQIWEESIYIQGSSGMMNLKVFPKHKTLYLGKLLQYMYV